MGKKIRKTAQVKARPSVNSVDWEGRALYLVEHGLAPQSILTYGGRTYGAAFHRSELTRSAEAS